MSTRRATTDSPLAQERYASARSGDILLGNLVAKKCETVTAPTHRRLILFFHDLSIRSGCRHHPTANLFPAWPIGDGRLMGHAFDRVAADLPALFPGQIKSPSEEVAKFITSLCLDPKCDPSIAVLPGCANVIDLLEAYRAKFCAAESRAIAHTEATSIVWSTLDYALSQGGMVLVEGTVARGKIVQRSSVVAKTCRRMPLCPAVVSPRRHDVLSRYRTLPGDRAQHANSGF